MSVEEAKNPQTSRERLTELAQSKDERLKKLLAQNPNTPVPVLFSLANQNLANLIVQNPVWEILYSEDPAFLHKYEPEALQFVKTFTFLSERFFFFISSHPNQEVAEMLAQNPNCTASKLERLVAHTSPKVRLAIAMHPRATRPMIAQLLNDEEAAVRSAAAKSAPPALRDLLQRLGSTDSSARVDRERQEERISAEELISFSAYGSWFASLAAQHPNTPISLLEALIESPSALVRVGVARSPAVTAGMLQRLSLDIEQQVREAVAQHSKCTAEILGSLSHDPSREVRVAVAEHVHCPGEALARLAKDPQERVLRAVAENPNTPQGSLCLLVDHQD